MSEKLTYEATPEIEGDTINIMQKINGEFSKVIFDTQDRMIREGLIALGWTPPETKPDPIADHIARSGQ